MTDRPFTEDDLETGKALHGEWNQAKEAQAQNAKAKASHSDVLWAYCTKMEGQTVRFWLREGESVLAALEKAWGLLVFFTEPHRNYSRGRYAKEYTCVQCGTLRGASHEAKCQVGEAEAIAHTAKEDALPHHAPTTGQICRLEIDFSYINLPREAVVEWVWLSSGRIVAMTEDESFLFDADGTSPKGSYLTPWPQSCRAAEEE